MSVIIAVFMYGYKGKTINFALCSSCHRTTIAHFLNEGKWDSDTLEDILKSAVISIIYNEAEATGKPVFCIVDDTIASKTKPSSKALHPIEDAYFHQSHLKKQQDYGHQAVSVMLSYNGITLNYAFVMYNKSKAKTKIVQDIAEELPLAPVISYFLCDCWYSSVNIMKSFLSKGFYTVGAIKSNRIIYPAGIKQKISEFALLIRKTDSNVKLVTIGSREYYVYRYEGNLNKIENAVVIISYPKDAFGNSRALRAFICINVSLTTDEILNFYLNRWEIEVFFRQCKNLLALDKYQIRKAKGIQRYWLLMSLAHFIACTSTDEVCSFEKEYALLRKEIQKEHIEYIYNCGKNNLPIDDILNLAA